MEKIYLVAGGTGGHINAALSIGKDYKKTYDVHYITGTRYLDYQLFKGENVIHLESKPLKVKNPIYLSVNIVKNIFVFIKLIFLFLKTKPKFFIGAGGYVCGPALLAGWILRKPIFIIEQNATVGLTNKLLAKISNRVFVHFEKTRGLENHNNLVLAGNPIRKDIGFSEQKLEGDKIKVLAYGGSLGANQINKSLYKYVPHKKENIHIHHQVGKDNINPEIVAKNYEQMEYISDMQKEYDWANIIVARSGASTVAELRVVGKPCILIPFPGHSDHHQQYNAEELKKDANFPVMILNSMASTKQLAEELEDIIENFEFSDKKLERTNVIDSFAIIDKEIQKCME